MDEKMAVRRDALGRFQARGPIGGSWECVEVQDGFLLHLSETSNVLRSCAAVGKTASGAYALRHRDPRFAERWRLALCEAAEGLQALLTEWALAEATLPRRPDGAPDRDAMARMTPALAMNLLAVHRETVRAGRPAAAMSADALRGAIAARLTALATEVAHGPAVVVRAVPNEERTDGAGANAEEAGDAHG